MTTLELDELLAYARCPLEWWWQYRAGQARPLTPDRMLRQALADALRFCREGHTADLTEALSWVWADWAEAWGKGGTVLQDLRTYAGLRNQVLAQMTRDRGRGPGLGQRLHAAGLSGLSRRLDRFAGEQGVYLAPGRAGPGSRFGDAFADSLLAAEMAHTFETPLQLAGAVLEGRGVVVIGSARVSGALDLVTAEGVAEVHDLVSRTPRRRRDAKHDPRTIFAAQCAIDGRPALEGRERSVVVRQWLTGVSYTFTETSPGYLHTLLGGLMRGLASQAWLPRAVADPEGCARCDLLATCQPSGWPEQHLLDPALAERTERLQKARRALRTALDARPEFQCVAGDALEQVAVCLYGDELAWPGEAAALVKEFHKRV